MVGVGYPTPMDRDTGLIRTDQIGRLRFTPAQRRILLDAFENSGQSASGFAAQHGIKYTTFATWVQKRRADQPGVRTSPAVAPARPLLLAEVSCEEACPPAGACGPLEVCLPGGVRLAIGGIVQVPLAAALIRELSRPC
jgi:transposase-like protein